MRLSIKNGVCVVSVPKYIPTTLIKPQIDVFIESKREWIIKHLEKASQDVMTPKEYKEKKKILLTHIQERLHHFNEVYNFACNTIKVKKMSSRWGSCSKRGNLNFNIKLLSLTEKQCDYVIVHELGHLKEFNHSKRFWDLVRETVPDYLSIRKKLKGGLF